MLLTLVSNHDIISYFSGIAKEDLLQYKHIWEVMNNNIRSHVSSYFSGKKKYHIRCVFAVKVVFIS